MPSDSITEKTPEPTRVETAVTATPPVGAAGALGQDTAADKPVEPAAPSVGREEPRFLGFDRVLAFLVLVLAFFLGSFAINNSDVLMSLATGRHIAEGTYQFGVDPYSFMTQPTATEPATPWVNHSWLYSFLLYLLYGMLGQSGLVVLHAILLVALTLVLMATRDRRSPLLAAVFVTGFAILALSVRYYLQPVALSMLLFGITLHLMYRAGLFGGIEAERIRPQLLWGVPILCALWVNLDNWFVLAPLTLGLVWAGMGVNRLIGRPNPVPGREVGIAFGATLLAGLFNPHLHGAYVLPPELGYFFVSLGLPMPGFLVPGGYTLAELTRQGSLTFLLSPLSGVYFSSPVHGGNIAGWSAFVLVFLGFITFLAQFLAVSQDGKSNVQGTRLVPWLVFVLFTLRSAVLVPWFAIFTGVVAALNLGEWLREREAVSRRPVNEAGPARLARLFSLLLLVMGLALAWPGWLHSRIGSPVSGRRVDWRFSLDPAQVETAQTLNTLNKAGKVKYVFNYHREAANYCAWYAPGVRCFFDSRHNLFPRAVVAHARWKQVLFDESELFLRQRDPVREKAAGDEWQQAFRAHQVDHLLLHFVNDRENRQYVIVQKAFLQPADWTLRFGSGSVAVFAWGGLTNTRPDEDYLQKRTREIFTQVPEQERPPREGFTPPQIPDTWDLYAKGRPDSLFSGESTLWLMRYNANWLATPGNLPPNRIAHLHGGLTAQIMGALLNSPAEIVPFYPLLGVGYRNDWIDFPLYPSGNSLFRPEDYGPPAVPLLMVQDARKQLATHPLDLGGYKQISQAYQVLHNTQEEYWSHFEGRRADQEMWNRTIEMLLQERKLDEKKDGKKDGKKEVSKSVDKPAIEKLDPAPHTTRWKQAASILRGNQPRIAEESRMQNQHEALLQASSFFSNPVPTFRRQVRAMQIMAYQRLAADLHPDNADLQAALAETYDRMHFFDASLDRWQKALGAVQNMKQTLEVAKAREYIEKKIESMEKPIKERRDQFERNRSGLAKGHPQFGPGWQMLYNFALLDPYLRFEKDDADPLGRGLPLTLLETFDSIPVTEMHPQELDLFLYLHLDLKLRLGLINEVVAYLGNDSDLEKQAVGPGVTRIRALVAAVLGRYDNFDRHAASMQSKFDPQLLQKTTAATQGVVLAGGLGSLPGSPPVFTWIAPQTQIVRIEHERFVLNVQRVDACLLRGLMALEAGDGLRAKGHLEEAIRLSGDEADDPRLRGELNIARRYLDWIERMKK